MRRALRPTDTGVFLVLALGVLVLTMIGSSRPTERRKPVPAWAQRVLHD